MTSALTEMGRLAEAEPEGEEFAMALPCNDMRIGIGPAFAQADEGDGISPRATAALISAGTWIALLAKALAEEPGVGLPCPVRSIPTGAIGIGAAEADGEGGGLACPVRSTACGTPRVISTRSGWGASCVGQPGAVGRSTAGSGDDPLTEADGRSGPPGKTSGMCGGIAPDGVGGPLRISGTCAGMAPGVGGCWPYFLVRSPVAC